MVGWSVVLRKPSTCSHADREFEDAKLSQWDLIITVASLDMCKSCKFWKKTCKFKPCIISLDDKP